MTSLVSNTFRSPKSGIAAQDLIVESFVVKNGMLRKRGQRFNIGKWPTRFAVLTDDMMYVYGNEASKTPKSKFSLLGYNRVIRCDVSGQDWCFSIMPASGVDSVKMKTFACFSDADRKLWMEAIRTQIYTANKIPKPVLTVLDKIKLMRIGDIEEEDDYVDIEHVVYETCERAVEVKESDNDSPDEDSDSSSDSEKNVRVCQKTKRSVSLPYNYTFTCDFKSSTKVFRSRKNSEYKIETKSSEFEIRNDLANEMIASQQKRRRKPSDPQPEIPSNCFRPSWEDTPRPNSDPVQSVPPRYSEVYHETEELDCETDERGGKTEDRGGETQERECDREEGGGESDYVNLLSINRGHYKMPNPSFNPSLESMCVVTDMCCDRLQLNALLKAKNEFGTYLIRKSRTDSQNVIAFLKMDGQVKELKIRGSPGNLSLDDVQYFTCTEELLKHYTYVEPLPNSSDFLRIGFHKVTGET